VRNASPDFSAKVSSNVFLTRRSGFASIRQTENYQGDGLEWI
jgi:hypothetical protein